MVTVFIAASPQQFEQAKYIGKFAREEEVAVLNPVVSLPCHLAQCCYLPIELAMLEASDVMWLISKEENARLRCLISYAETQHIPIVTSTREFINELSKYEGYDKQVIMEGVEKLGSTPLL